MGLIYHKHPIDGCNLGQEYCTEFPAGDGDYCGSGIIISHGVAIYPPYRGQGHGSRLHAERLARFKQEGYSLALCTVRRDNEPQLKILKKAGWVRLMNTCSAGGDPIYLMGINLK